MRKKTNKVKRSNIKVFMILVLSIILSCAFSVNVAAAHKHSWSSRQHNSEVHWKVCSSCGEYKQVETHTLYEYKRVNATWSKNGYVKYKCKCGYKCKKVLKSSKAHKYDSGKITVSPTCQTNGTKRYTCNYCGKTKDEIIPANNLHTARYWQCNEYGHWLTCDRCNTVYNSASHDFDNGVITSNNANNYVVTYTCETCGYKKYETKNKTCTHSSQYWYCDDTGHWLTCDKCGAKYNFSSHTFHDYTITSNDGKIYCSTCGYSVYRDSVPKNLGILYIEIPNYEIHKGDVINFTIKYSGVNSLQNLKIYLDGVEVNKKILKLVYLGNNMIKYNLDTTSLNKGCIKLNVTADNCTEILTNLEIK